jgi:hypothetical protein
MNVNQVSLRTSNSAGLVSLSDFVADLDELRLDVETWGVIAGG